MPDNNTQPQDSQSAMQTPAGESVFVMPNKYVVQPPAKSGKGWTLAIIILIAVILVSGSYLLYSMLSESATKTTSTVQSPPQIVIENATSTAMENATTTPEIASSTAETAVSTTTETTTTAVSLSLSVDSDADGLTDIEETVLGTLPTNPDTDGDGYKDGAEVTSGYSPTKAGSAKIDESPFVVKMDGSFTSDYFQFLMPKDWQSSTIAANRQMLISASTGEIIKISISDNRDNMTALGWYLRDHPEIPVSQLKTITSFDGALTGIYAPDGLTAWLTDAARSKLYTFEYLTGRQTEIRYPALFGLIIKSLTTITPVTEVVPTSSITEETSTI